MMENETLVTEFVSVGLTNRFQLQVVLCVIFLLVSVATFLGNLGVITLIWMDSRLHSPMTFFLSYLSLVDVCSSSVIGPKMLTDIFVETKAISFFGCGQCVVTVSSWLPWQRLACGLLYTLIMSQWVCGQLVVTPYTVGLISTVIHTTFTFHLPYCGPKINHFFCDLLPVLSLARADTRINEVLLSSWLELQEYPVARSSWSPTFNCHHCPEHPLCWREGEAFSTCSSHLTAVSSIYGTFFFIPVHPSSSFSLDMNKVVFVFYTALIPILNPLIYSPRNKEVK